MISARAFFFRVQKIDASGDIEVDIGGDLTADRSNIPQPIQVDNDLSGDDRKVSIDLFEFHNRAAGSELSGFKQR